jgi:hypothetical protein
MFLGLDPEVSCFCYSLDALAIDGCTRVSYQHTLVFLTDGSATSTTPAVLAKIAFPAIRDGWITGPVSAGAGESATEGGAWASEKSPCLRLVAMLVDTSIVGERD